MGDQETGQERGWRQDILLQDTLPAIHFLQNNSLYQSFQHPIDLQLLTHQISNPLIGSEPSGLNHS